ncbi:MAG: hypothetical protein MUC97_07070 [Bernardetiaceae bacterium]|nr:hypothetical protein [Bernardetiaceae bacterium]
MAGWAQIRRGPCGHGFSEKPNEQKFSVMIGISTAIFGDGATYAPSKALVVNEVQLKR